MISNILFDINLLLAFIKHPYVDKIAVVYVHLPTFIWILSRPKLSWKSLLFNRERCSIKTVKTLITFPKRKAGGEVTVLDNQKTGFTLCANFSISCFFLHNNPQIVDNKRIFVGLIKPVLMVCSHGRSRKNVEKRVSWTCFCVKAFYPISNNYSHLSGIEAEKLKNFRCFWETRLIFTKKKKILDVH